METILCICLGLALSATCGFRVFLPILGLGIASASGHLTLADGFQWIGSPVALFTLSVATFAEIAAYYIPWFDNLMDTAATPAAVVAGTMATASLVGDTSPVLRWSLAAIAGGAAGVVQVGTVAVRGASTATTGGTANPVVATAELGGAIMGTILALVVPLLAAIAAIALCIWTVRALRRALPRMVASLKSGSNNGVPQPR